MLRSLGATPVVVDALDREALVAAVRRAAPTHVIHELTNLPKAGPRRSSDMVPTNRLRTEGTRNLLDAAVASGARRIIAGSFALLGSAPGPSRQEGRILAATQAVQSMESQILDAARRGVIEGIVLRYGLVYGHGNPSTEELIALVRKRRLPRIRDDRGKLPFIHLDDAVAATIASLNHGSSASVYNIVDDRPASFSEMLVEMANLVGAPPPFAVPAWFLRLVVPFMGQVFGQQLMLSNDKARRELGWVPRYPSFREGLRQTLAVAA
jgi:nucleoside-diphosphate-sugar epimerase